MFQLNRLVLNNFKIHENLELNFETGITGIIGPNGSGKSSIIEAFQFLMTGETETPKADLITVGKHSGYVLGEITIHGKHALLKRYLDASKVYLEYDNNKFTKATEVKELWLKILQIDASIINNVIIARQSQIPLLFCGDNSLREKIFQKIFLIPPTEKIRKIVWDSFISKAPAPRPVVDIEEKEFQILELQTILENLLQQQEKLQKVLLSTHELHQLIVQENELTDLLDIINNKPNLIQEISTLQTQLKILQSKEQELRSKLSNGNELKNQYNYFLVEKGKYDSFVANRNKYLKLKQQLDEQQQTVLTWENELQSLSCKVEEIKQVEQTIKHKLQLIETFLNSLQYLKDKSVCLLCNQPIKNLDENLSRNQNLLIELTVKYNEIQYILGDLNKRITYLTSQINSYKENQKQLEQLNNFNCEINFDPVTFASIEQQVKYYELNQSELQSLVVRINKLQIELQAQQNQLSKINNYNGEELNERLLIIRNLLQTNKQNHEQLINITQEIQVLKTKISMLQETINESKINQTYNNTLQTYLDKLQSVYTIFSTNRFPRRLIQNYTKIVEQELEEQLKHFNLPYTPSISNDFKIEMLDKLGRKIPSLSGGQTMIVGLCLRLALHNLFSQAFPILIIDEGTTHLHKDNVTLYFDFINQLKDKTHINQIIIIDHHEDLKNVVDHVIEL